MNMKDILQDRYREKLVTAEQIANMIKSGGKVFIGEFAIRRKNSTKRWPGGLQNSEMSLWKDSAS